MNEGAAALLVLLLAAPGGQEPRTLSAAERFAQEVEDAQYRLASAEDQPGSATLALALHELATLLEERGDYERARSLCQRALDIRAEVLGSDSPETAASLDRLASVTYWLGDYAAARTLAERALAIRKDALGADHPLTAESLTRLGMIRVALGDYPGARRLLERALAMDERAGAEEPRTARTLVELAWLSSAEGDSAAARPLAERAVDIFEATLGPDHPETARGLDALAWADVQLGEYATAQRFAERAVAIREEVFGPDHPELVDALDPLAGALDGQGEREAARSLQERALQLCEARLGPDHPGTGVMLNNLAYLLQAQGDATAARPLYVRALAIHEAVVGRENPATAVVLYNLADLLWAQDERAEARSLYARALEIREKTLGEHHALTIRSLARLANVTRQLGEHADAIELYERLVDVREAVDGPEHERVAGTLYTLALVYRALDDYESARECLERALLIHENNHGREHHLVAVTLNDLALTLDGLGHYDSARTLYEEAAAIHAKVNGPEHPATLMTLGNLATTLRKLGEYDASRRLNVRVLEIREASLDPEHPHVALSLQGLARVLRAQGEYEAARPLFERALHIYEKRRGPTHFMTLSTLDQLGWLLMDLDEPEAARPLFESELARAENAYGRESERTAIALNSLGVLLARLGEPERALELHEQALAIRERILGPEHPMTALSLSNLGWQYIDEGWRTRRPEDFGKALELQERALAIRQTVLGPENPTTAESLHSVAGTLHALSHFDEARRHYEEALDVRERVLGPSHPDVLGVLRGLAFLAKVQGDEAQALELFQRIYEADPDRWSNLVLFLLDSGRATDASEILSTREGTLEEQRLQRLASLSEGDRYSYLARMKWELDTELAVAAHADSPELRVRAYEQVLGWKGQIARLVLASRERLAAEATAEQRALLARLRIVQRRLSLRDLDAGEPMPAVHVDELRALREERARLEVELSRALGVDSGARGASFAEVAAALPEDAALVDFFVHPRRRLEFPEDEPVREWMRWTEDRVSVWITRSGDDEPQEPIWLDLGPAAELEEAVREYLETVVARGGGGRGISPGATQRRVSRGERLRALLWTPLREHLAGVDTLFVSPDGFLGTLSLEVLPLADGHVLLERHGVVYLQDASRLVQRRECKDAPFDSLLAVGGVDFRNRGAPEKGAPDVLAMASPVRGAFGDGWERLPATEVESQAVYDLHDESFGDAHARLLLQDDAATEERVKLELPRYRVLHLATHGFFNPPGIASLWESAQAEVEKEEALMSAAYEERRLVASLPGLLSGLVCAGASRPKEGRDDGYLTAEEVGWLDLSDVELVVLSACDTGLGRAQSGEGLIGLRRAFETAGARTVVSSLWSVQDESTAELMRDFYANLWRKGMGRYEALRAAQLALLARNRAERGDVMPGTWGAFVLSGEWR